MSEKDYRELRQLAHDQYDLLKQMSDISVWDLPHGEGRAVFTSARAEMLRRAEALGVDQPLELSQETNVSEPLKATSNVIELKPGHKYMLCFKRLLSRDETAHLQQIINAYGVQSIIVGCDADIEVIELPETTCAQSTERE